jgi:cytidylate kinase
MMHKQPPSVEKFVQNQVKKWKAIQARKELEGQPRRPVVTLSMQPGSRGSIVAEEVAHRLNYDLFNREMIKKIAQSAKMSEAVIESVEKERRLGIDDFVASIIKRHYLHPDTYLNHLMRVVCAIADYGRAVIVGRGANFILPLEMRFSVRIVAPLEMRIKNVAAAFKVAQGEAKKRVLWRQSRRVAFIRQFFNADINDPFNYDMMLNMENISIACAAEAIAAAVGKCRDK